MDLRSKEILIVMDSVRWDQFQNAETPNLDQMEVKRAHAQAPDTPTSMLAYLRNRSPNVVEGILSRCEEGGSCHPKRSPARVRQAFYRGLEHFKKPLSTFFKQKGYYTGFHSANPYTGMMREWLSTDFDEFRYDYEFNGREDDDILRKPLDHPNRKVFMVLWLMSTHNPYYSGEGTADYYGGDDTPKCKRTQQEAISYCDGLIGDLVSHCPKDTHLIITSDHGETFKGELGDVYGHEYYRRGHSMHNLHPKTFRVPFIECRIQN